MNDQTQEKCHPEGCFSQFYFFVGASIHEQMNKYDIIYFHNMVTSKSVTPQLVSLLFTNTPYKTLIHTGLQWKFTL